ncbi:MAG: CapA family protein [Myxococcales bacterium FL481]|nr:MAG: CapA family protein [Myxococcales bacterium FL481]
MALLVAAPGCRRSAPAKKTAAAADASAAPSPTPDPKGRLEPSNVEVYAPAELEAQDWTPEPGTHAIVLVGDLMPWERIEEKLAAFGPHHPYLGTAPLVRAADLAIANLEGPVAVEATPNSGLRFPYKMPPSILPAIRETGFDLVSAANNHALDCGPEGLLETLKFVGAAGIDLVGAGPTPMAASQPFVTQVGDTRIAVVAFMSPETWYSEIEDDSAKEHAFRNKDRRMRKTMMRAPDRPAALVGDVGTIREAVRQASETADVVIVYPHWGVRYHRPVYPRQREIARAAIDAGADLVVGHHNHIWQPIERYRDALVVYGVGNYAFGSRNRRAKEGLIVRAVVRNKAFERVELYPLYTKNLDDKIDFQPKLLKGKSARKMLTRLRDAADEPVAGFGIEGDHAVVRLVGRNEGRP